MVDFDWLPDIDEGAAARRKLRGVEALVVGLVLGDARAAGGIDSAVDRR